MKATISMNSIWRMIRPLSLDNRQWLLEKLQKSIKEEEEKEYISKEEILAGIEAGLKDLKAGKMQPFDEFLKEMKDEM